VARALIVGCGCRGRALGTALREQGWIVRGTTRDASGLAAIEASGIEAVCADPDRVGEILDHIADVAVICWLMGTASGTAECVSALHGARLERLLEELVDTPVRGFVYEGAGSVSTDLLQGGRAAVERAWRTWRIPFAVVSVDPASHDEWLADALPAANRVLSVS
jgi:nucleoside-diphosphate-sugar epimerase